MNRAITARVISVLRRIYRRIALNGLQANSALWAEIQQYRSRSKSTGCGWSDLWTMYTTVRRLRPKEILEFGPGMSTVILSHALMENQRDGHPGRITSMEDNDYYLAMARDLHPPSLREWVDFVGSPRRDYTYEIFRGVGYQQVPERSYDFVFIDGPEHHAVTDGQFCFDFDFINVLRKARNDVYALVDYRISTSFVLQTLLPANKVRFDAVRGLCFIGPCTCEDLVPLELGRLTAMVERNAKLFGHTKLQLR